MSCHIMHISRRWVIRRQNTGGLLLFISLVCSSSSLASSSFFPWLDSSSSTSSSSPSPLFFSLSPSSTCCRGESQSFCRQNCKIGNSCRNWFAPWNLSTTSLSPVSTGGIFVKLFIWQKVISLKVCLANKYISDGGSTSRGTSRMIGGARVALQKPTRLSKQIRHQCNHKTRPYWSTWAPV